MNHFQEKNFFEFLLIRPVSRVHEDGRQSDYQWIQKMITDEIFCEIEIRFTILHFKFKEM